MSLKAGLAIFFTVALIGFAACKNSASGNNSGSNLSKSSNPSDTSSSATSGQTGSSGVTSGGSPNAPSSDSPTTGSSFEQKSSDNGLNSAVKAGLLEPNIDGQRG
ncbi:MAG TPA: hypothetical protein VKH64_08655 [Candidatus Binatia bacterium]|nr:hypothetical protein [Candidatus Binatia bacterium]